MRRLISEVPDSLFLIAGPNNSGKSTLLRALELFFSFGLEATWIDPEGYAPKNEYYSVESPRALTRIRLHFGALTTAEEEEFASALLPRSKTFWSEVRISRTGQVAFNSSKDADAKQIYELVSDKYHLIHLPVLRIGADGVANTETKRLTTAVKQFLVRSRPGRENEEQKRFSSQFRRFCKTIEKVLKDSKKAAGEVLPEESVIEFEMPNASEVLDQFLERLWIRTHPTAELSLRDEGTGFQSLLALGLLKFAANSLSRRNQSLLFLIEEPEAFLHPQYQRAVAAYLSNVSEKAQVFVTTHSPTIVDSTDIKNILRLQRDPDGVEWEWHPTELSETEEGRLARFCDAKNSELIFSERVLLCEGISDAKVYGILLADRLSVDLHRSNISVIEMDGRDSAPRFVELVRRFGIPYLMVLDKDAITGDRATLKAIAKSLSLNISNQDYRILDRVQQNVRDQSCVTFAKAAVDRKAANAVLQKLGIFCLSSDIEGAVVTSFRRQEVLRVLGPNELKHYSNEVHSELNLGTGAAFHRSLMRATGSKGWLAERAVEANKPKQHLLATALDKMHGGLVRNSDLAELCSQMRVFLKSDELIAAPLGGVDVVQSNDEDRTAEE